MKYIDIYCKVETRVEKGGYPEGSVGFVSEIDSDGNCIVEFHGDYHDVIGKCGYSEDELTRRIDISMDEVPKELEDVFIRGDKIELDSNNMPKDSKYKGNAYKIYYCCDCHFGGRFCLEIINLGGRRRSEEYIKVDEDDFFNVCHCFARHIPGFDEYEYVNPIKESAMDPVYNDLEEYISKLEKEEPDNTDEIKYAKALLWYFYVYKSFHLSQTGNILNIVGF